MSGSTHKVSTIHCFEKEAAQSIQDILNTGNPRRALIQFLNKNSTTHPKLCIKIYEEISIRRKITDYWIYYLISNAFLRTGDIEAAYKLAVMADELAPTARSWHLYRTMFNYHLSKGREREAIAVALKQLSKDPDHPVVAPQAIKALISRHGVELPAGLGRPPAPDQPAAVRRTRIVEELKHPLAPPRQLGGRTMALEIPWEKLQRPEITVTELSDATVLTQNNRILVLDANDQLHEMLSIAGYPSAVLNSFHQIQSSGMLAEESEYSSAVIIKDRFSAQNLCHFLLDHMPRLELYRRAGVDIAASAVISEPPATPFMEAITHAFGVREIVGCDRRRRIRVRRLYVTDNCNATLRHPAHHGSAWAIDAVRSAFPEGNTSPSRMKLYISRRDAQFRRVANEQEVENVLAASGFQTVVASALPYPSQVALFRSASHIVGLHGSGLANIVFCAPDARVLELFHPAGSNPDYAILAGAMGLHYTALVGADAGRNPEFRRC